MQKADNIFRTKNGGVIRDNLQKSKSFIGFFWWQFKKYFCFICVGAVSGAMHTNQTSKQILIFRANRGWKGPTTTWKGFMIINVLVNIVYRGWQIDGPICSYCLPIIKPLLLNMVIWLLLGEQGSRSDPFSEGYDYYIFLYLGKKILFFAWHLKHLARCFKRHPRTRYFWEILMKNINFDNLGMWIESLFDWCISE